MAKTALHKKRLPPLTHLQVLVLGTLLAGEQPGRVVRKALAGYGVRRTPAAFYQTMARLEGGGLVQGWYGQVTVGDQAVTERRYRLAPAGARALAETQRFYDELGAVRSRFSDA